MTKGELIFGSFEYKGTLVIARRYIQPQFSTLIVHLYSISSLSFMFFCRPKERKAPAQSLQVHDCNFCVKKHNRERQQKNINVSSI